MNTPTHIACGACLALAVTHLANTREGSGPRPLLLGIGAVVIGVASHLLLDLMPHHAWIVFLDWFKPLPFHWLIREAVFGAAVAIPAMILAGKSWPYVGLGMLGALYPDVEKVLAVDFHLPEAYVLFPWHSAHLSSRTGGLPESVLIEFECFLTAAFLIAMWRMNNTNAFIRKSSGGNPFTNEALAKCLRNDSRPQGDRHVRVGFRSETRSWLILLPVFPDFVHT
ncbi:MAG: hypothetical protein AB1646_15310, partial [Thermodesulfobacteriota bacterium]